MGQDGGNPSSLPASLFEIDELDTHWDDDASAARKAEPASEIQATGPAPFDVPTLEFSETELEPGEDPLSGEFPVEPGRISDFELPLIHGDGVPLTPYRAPEHEPGLAPPEAPPPTVRPGTREKESRLEASPATLGACELDEAAPASDEDPLLGGLMGELRDRYATGDYSGALSIAEELLQSDPEHELARRYAGHCREVLEQMAASQLGALDQIISVAVESDRLRWLSLDHRAGFLLSLVDGTLSIEELLDISGMARFEALRILCELLEQNVIALSCPQR